MARTSRVWRGVLAFLAVVAVPLVLMGCATHAEQPPTGPAAKQEQPAKKEEPSKSEQPSKTEQPAKTEHPSGEHPK